MPVYLVKRSEVADDGSFSVKEIDPRSVPKFGLVVHATEVRVLLELLETDGMLVDNIEVRSTETNPRSRL